MKVKNMIKDLCKNAKSAKAAMSVLPTAKKNKILVAVADGLIKEQDSIIAANNIDLEEGKKNGLSEALLDRLTLTEARIEAMAESLRTIAGFPDPIGEIVEGFNTESGLKIEKVRSALGVVAIIYESRPNVTIDAAGLCLKASNVAILRGSSAAIHSNKVLADLFRRIGQANGMPDHAVQLVEDVSHERLDELIKEDEYIDVLIPRGGEGLKQAMKEKSSIPIIMTGAGTCHIYVDESAVEEQAIPIILNAKTQRPGTCNSVECVLLHKNKIPFLAELVEELLENEVKVNLSKVLYDKLPDNLKSKSYLASNDLLGYEFLSKEILLDQVDSVEQAIQYINKYGSQHSDAILTKDLNNSEKFLNQVDSAVVYLNASTRFSDGGEFGFGGEIGISTQKLHARGPMGIKQLTSERFIVRGQGHIRS